MKSLISGNVRGDLIGLVTMGEDLFTLQLLNILHEEVEYVIY